MSILIIFLVAFTVLFIIIFLMMYLDNVNKSKSKKKPFLSFMIPTYNDSTSISSTIKSIYNSYDNKRFEIIVINDKSTDNTLKVLKDLKKDYSFKIINNKENKGKVRGINDNFISTKGEIIVVIDSDSKVTPKGLSDIINRFSRNENLGAVSARYASIENTIFSQLQEIDYNMQAFILAACNKHSTISLLGACMAVKREAFIKAGLLTVNAITEDLDLALKLNKLGYKVEQSFIPVYTRTPENLKQWYNQKIRWSSGFSQCFMKYYPFYFKHPIFIFFTLMYTLITLMFVGHTLMANLSPPASFSSNLTGIGLGIINTFFTIPYIIPMIKSKKELPKLLLAIPFVMIYFPIYSSVLIIGLSKGIYKHFTLKENEAGWKKE